MRIGSVKGAGLALLAGVALVAPLGTAANAGMLDQLRSRGFGEFVDKYVEQKNGEYVFKRNKNGSLAEFADRVGGVKNAAKKYTDIIR